jgi:hypothetical protein
MRPIAIKKLTLVLGALLLGADAACAQMVIDPDRAPRALPEKPHPTLPDFSMQQRASIYRSVVASTREHNTVPVPSDRQIVVGSTLVDPAQLESAPEDVRTLIPASSNYKYAVWNNQVLLVEPNKQVVVDIGSDDPASVQRGKSVLVSRILFTV